MDLYEEARLLVYYPLLKSRRASCFFSVVLRFEPTKAVGSALNRKHDSLESSREHTNPVCMVTLLNTMTIMGMMIMTRMTTTMNTQ